jgi:mannose PTS system EIIC component
VAVADYLLAGTVAVGAGLDRTAAGQFMISRPIVAAPLVGWLLGAPLTGLQVGAMVELLWLGRLPIGAAIPPDDTQVAIGATVLAITLGPLLHLDGVAFAVLCLLVALPLGKVGQLFDRVARQCNDGVFRRALRAVEDGQLQLAENYHLRGLGHFAISSLATFVLIIAGGSLLLHQFAEVFIEPVHAASPWLMLLFPLLGTAMLLGTANVSRAMTLFIASFATALLMLWLA